MKILIDMNLFWISGQFLQRHVQAGRALSKCVLKTCCRKTKELPL
jgi:hypothetical protein